MVKCVTHKTIFLLFLYAFIFNLFSEILFLLLKGSDFRVVDVFFSFITLPLTVMLGSVVDRLFLGDISLCYFVSVCFYPFIIIALVFRNKLYLTLGSLFYFILMSIFFLVTLAPIHRFWAIMSV